MSAETVCEKIARVKPLRLEGEPEEKPRFRLQTVPELLAAPPPVWTVHEVIPDHGIGVIWGASGSGKTFAVLDLACAVVRGIPWHDRSVVQGAVLYVATEGRLARRLEAYIDHQRILADELAGLRVIESRVNLLGGDASPLIESIGAYSLPDLRLVIIDTLNRAMPGGNENASEDMGRMVEAASAIADATGSAVIYVHHSGKDDAKGSRGHSSLKAATEFELSVRRDGEARRIEVEKVRDADDGYTLAGFTLVPVGDSVVLSPAEVPVLAPKAQRLAPAERIALDALNGVLQEHGKRRDSPSYLIDHGAKLGQYVALIDDWREEMYSRLGTDLTQESRKKRFQRAREGLQAKRRVVIHDEFAWLP